MTGGRAAKGEGNCCRGEAEEGCNDVRPVGNRFQGQPTNYAPNMFTRLVLETYLKILNRRHCTEPCRIGAWGIVGCRYFSTSTFPSQRTIFVALSLLKKTIQSILSLHDIQRHPKSPHRKMRKHMFFFYCIVKTHV